MEDLEQMTREVLFEDPAHDPLADNPQRDTPDFSALVSTANPVLCVRHAISCANYAHSAATAVERQKNGGFPIPHSEMEQKEIWRAIGTFTFRRIYLFF